MFLAMDVFGQASGSNSEWLLELCMVERRADYEAADEFLNYLMEYHRPSGPRDSGSSILVVPLHQPALGPHPDSRLVEGCRLAGRFLPQSWDELVRFATALGPLLPVAIRAGHVAIRSLPQARDGNHHTAFAHCCRQLAAWFAAIGPIVLKVGIAADPGHRFWNPEFGYETERTWHFMDVVWPGPAIECRRGNTRPLLRLDVRVDVIDEALPRPAADAIIAAASAPAPAAAAAPSRAAAG